ncbi:hypothetical protein I4F81_000650 [Pyropia yezoensis]|uniref:Uncharacterized protein n=1 Tax=Pyropia yezoensis TaxID=2788 RepID=A0ACC3BKM0_PYRYE|nr:hypothetical protein I4F81_000650 [Neopyropia yezoensis]
MAPALAAATASLATVEGALADLRAAVAAAEAEAAAAEATEAAVAALRRRVEAVGGAVPPPARLYSPLGKGVFGGYIRGRLTEAKVAAVAAALTSALAWKYGLLRRRPAALSPADAASRDALEGMAKAETGGRPYVTEGDVRRWGGVKMDATWKGGVGLLRHVGSIKEVRGVGGKVKAWLVMGEGE